MYRWADCELDVPGRELRRSGTPVHLEPQAFDLLAYLVEHRDRVVPKLDLLDGVWGHRFVSEANLTTRVKEIRRAVGDDGSSQHTIRNVRGRGYRFVASVDVVEPVAPVTATGTLIGREAEVRRIVDLLAGAPVVTVIGPGGVGKSTLARAAARSAGSRHAAGCLAVDLGALDGGEPVLPSVARALDIAWDPERPGNTVRAVARLDALVLLDTCEHVVDPVADLLHQVLTVEGARLRVLATSTIRLGLSAEEIVRVAPLTPDAARALFLLRARSADPDRRVEDVPPERLDAFLTSLDRLPLTVEMAAARLGSMTFDELEAALGDGMRLVQVSHRSPVRRHRSLESLVTWSAALLDPGHRRTLTDFSVFAAAVTAADAGAVLAPDRPAAAVFDLASLAEQSLLAVEPDPDATRYRMLTTVRTVAAAWSESSGSAERLRARHAAHFAEVVAAVDDSLRSSEELWGRRRLDEVVDEVRAAHRWASEHDPTLAATISGSLQLAAYTSFWQEPAAWSRDLLERHPGTAGLDGARLVVAGAAAHRGDLATARALAATLTDTQRPRIRSDALEILTDVELYAGDLPAVHRAAASLERLGDELGDRHASLIAVVARALALAYGDEIERGLELLGRVDETDAAPSDRAWLAYTRGELLGLLGEFDGAVDALGTSIELSATVDHRYAASVARTSLAMVHARAGAMLEALDVVGVCLHDALRHGNLIHAVTTLRNLVEVLVLLGDDEDAVVLAAAMRAEELRASYGAEAMRHGELLDTVARRVGHVAFTEWSDAGRSMGLDAALRMAARVVDARRDAILS